MKRALSLAACVLALAVVAGTVSAQVGVVSNVKVISNRVADVTTLEDWKATYIKPGMSDHDKALAIWKTVTLYRHQTSPPNEYFYAENVHDPMKTIHVYGYGMCCCAASNIEGLGRYLGYPARGRILNAHSLPELFYGNAWHMLDSSLMNFFTREDGSLASIDDIRAAVRTWFRENPDLAKELRGNDAKLREFAKNEGWKRGPALLNTSTAYDKNGINTAGWHGWPSTMQEYDWSDQKAAVFDYGPSMGYQVNVQLRVGEKLTRNWSNKGLHVNMPEADPGILSNAQWNTVNSLQRKFGDVAPGRVGNGVLEWTVPLDKLASVALSTENVMPGLARAGDPNRPGAIVLRMPSSYVYLTGKAELKAVVGAGGSIVVCFSDNQGLDWKEIEKIEATGEKTINLSSRVIRRYDYRLKFELKGAGTGLDAQHSQAPLPAVLEGPNTITFSAGPQEGTITYEGMMNTDTPNKDRQVLVTDFHPVLEGLGASILRVGDTGTGTATFTLATPGDMTRIRMNLHYRSRDAKDGYDAEASFDDGKTWAAVAKFEGPVIASSKYVVFDKVPANTRRALLRLTGHQRNTACIFDMRIDADYREPAGGFRPVKVTYVWAENGGDKTNVHVCYAPKDVWVITCGAEAVPKSYTVELAE